jgi:replicative DNA helicase
MDEERTVTDRIPPYSEEAERGILGSIMVDDQPGRCMGLALKNGLTGDSFYVPAHQALFGEMQKMLDEGLVLDLITVPQWLKDRGVLEKIGGPAALEKLVDTTPTSAHCEFYVKIVKAKHKRRRLIQESREVIEQCYASEDGEGTIVSAALGRFTDIADDLLNKERSNAEVLETLLATWESAHTVRNSGADHLPGLKGPFWRENQVLGGHQPGLHFKGGKSSAGKTAKICNQADYWAMTGHPGLIIQLDDTHEDMLGRIVAMRAAVSLPRLSQGWAKRGQLDKIRKEVAPAIAKLPIYIVEDCADVIKACALARYYKARRKIEWLIIDYVQILDADGNPRDDERQRLAKIAKYLKRLWKELRIPVIVVSQTSKFKDADDDGLHADMSDLFGASELFHAATSVEILKKVNVATLPEQQVPETENDFTKKYAVAGHIVKNKHGPRDQLVHYWLTPKYFLFEETRRVGTGTNERQMTWWEDAGLG